MHSRGKSIIGRRKSLASWPGLALAKELDDVAPLPSTASSETLPLSAPDDEARVEGEGEGDEREKGEELTHGQGQRREEGMNV